MGRYEELRRRILCQPDEVRDLLEKRGEVVGRPVDARIGEEGQLFGSITSAQIADAIASQLGVEVDRKRVSRGNAIKQAGRHEVEVNFYRDITAKFFVLVGVTDDAPAAEPEVEVVEEAETAEETDAE